MIALVLAAALFAADAPAVSYEELVAQGLALAREGRLDEATASLDLAVARQPARPEAFVERGGLRFLQARYDAAVSDLERALAIREDPYTRDLLASSLQLAGRSDDAIARWNVLGQPLVRSLAIQGLQHTQDRVARRELSLAEGDLLGLDALRASRLRLQEVGIFDRVTLRPIPRGEGKADLEVALVERHGFFQAPADLLVSSAVNALARRFRLRYANLSGSGLSLGGQYRWQENRPELSVALDWPRPLGVPGYLHLAAFRGNQAYYVGGPFARRSHGFDLSLRHVLGARSVGQLEVRTNERTFSMPKRFAPPGRLLGIGAGLERRLVDRYRQRVEAGVHGFRTTGGDVDFSRVLVRVGYRAFLSKPEGVSIEPSVLAAQIQWGWEGAGTPVDEMFAPGGSPEMELPLRAHRQTRDGVLGVAPLVRSLLLGNLEWRRRLMSRPGVALGVVVFADVAWLGRAAAMRDPQGLQDVGCGLRVALPGAPVLRLDYGRGLADGKNALFVGLGQVF